MPAQILSTVEIGQTPDAVLLDLYANNYLSHLDKNEDISARHVSTKIENAVGKTIMGAMPVVSGVGAGVLAASIFAATAPLAAGVGVITAAAVGACVVVGMARDKKEMAQELETVNANLQMIEQVATARPGFADRLAARRASVAADFNKGLDQSMKVEPEEAVALAATVAAVGASVYIHSRKKSM